MRRLLLVTLSAAVSSCTPMPQEGVLELSVTPNAITADGAEANVKVRAFDGLGNVGQGTVSVRATAGTLASQTLTLDGFGTAETTFSCSVAVDPACTGTVRVTAQWVNKDVRVEGVASVRVGRSGGSGGGAAGPSDAGLLTPLLIGATNNMTDFGLGTFQSPSSTIRLGINPRIGIDLSGTYYDQMLLTQSGDLLYTVGDGSGVGNIARAGFRIFKTDGTDMPISGPGCESRPDTRWFDSPNGLLYSCADSPPNRGVILNVQATGAPLPVTTNPIIANTGFPIDGVAADGSVLVFQGSGYQILKNPTDMPPIINTSRCEIVVAVGNTFLCSFSRQLVRLTATTLRPESGRFGPPIAGLTRGTTSTLAVLDRNGDLLMAHRSDDTSSSRMALVRFRAPVMGNMGAAGEILVDSMSWMPPNPPQLWFQARMRPVSRSFYP